MQRFILTLFLILSICSQAFTQKGSLPSLFILDLDVSIEEVSSSILSQFIRIDLENINRYDLRDHYDLKYLAEQRGIKANDCHGQLCGLTIGKALEADKVLVGSLSKFNNNLLLVIRILDVESKTVEYSSTVEYIDNIDQLRNMVRLSISRMFGKKYDKDLNSKLTRKFDFENSINIPKQKVLELNGPRFGVMFYTGNVAKILQAPRSEGGMEAIPVLSQIGYQAEFAFLNNGQIQGLVELIPMVTGLEQGLLIPSITTLAGFRNSRNGIEFAIGPTASIIKKKSGYFDEQGQWHDSFQPDAPYPIIERWHSDGWLDWHFGFVLSAGKTFRSGTLNIPVNIFFLPARRGNHRIGISMGYNSITEKRKRLSPKKKY